MNNPIDYKGKTVFIAGGTSGINLGVAEEFARAGARLAVLSRNPDKVDAAVATLSGHGVSAMGVAADVRDYEAVEDAFRKVETDMGPLDVLVSGAAGNFPARALDMSSKGFRAVVDIDLVGTFHVMRAGYQSLRKPGACVINISAPQAFVPAPLQSHVCAAKAGVDMLTRVLALDASLQDGLPGAKSELDSLEDAQHRLAGAAGPEAVAGDVHASLQRLRGGLDAGTERP